jgi:glycosyltransferase involved in cell wall biosynthesis
MKILLVITKAEIGGAQTFILSLARDLKKNGCEVAVAFGEGDYLPDELKKEDIPFFRLHNLKRSKNIFSTFLFIKELKELINKESFDIVHLNSTNTLSGVFAAKLSRVKPKTIFTVHGLSVFDPEYKASKLLKTIFKTYFKFFLRFVNKIVFVSEYNLKEAIKQNITNKGVVIYNGIEILSNYFLDEVAARYELSRLINNNLGGCYVVGSIGRLAEQKNYDFILENWLDIKKIKPTAKLIIIGEGPERKKYEKIINDLNINDDVFLAGEIKDASRLIKGFNLFVLPSIYEGLSVSLIEALFAGAPILASDVGGNKEVIGEENCFKLNDGKEFSEKLKNVPKVTVPSSLFSANIMAQKYKDIYESK